MVALVATVMFSAWSRRTGRSVGEAGTAANCIRVCVWTCDVISGLRNKGLGQAQTSCGFSVKSAGVFESQ